MFLSNIYVYLHSCLKFNVHAEVSKSLRVCDLIDVIFSQYLLQHLQEKMVPVYITKCLVPKYAWFNMQEPSFGIKQKIVILCVAFQPHCVIFIFNFSHNPEYHLFLVMYFTEKQRWGAWLQQSLMWTSLMQQSRFKMNLNNLSITYLCLSYFFHEYSMFNAQIYHYIYLNSS